MAPIPTPLIPLLRLQQAGAGRVYLKVDSFHPTASAFDRVAAALVDAAPGAAVVMASMGDLAIAVAPHCNARGKLLSVYLPESVTPERREILRSFGATVTLTPVEEHYVGAVAAAQNHGQRHPEVSLLASDALRRAEGMAETLGREWLAQLIGVGLPPQAVVLGVGTGATLCGVGTVLQRRFPELALVPVFPTTRPHHLTGLGLSDPGEILSGLRLALAEQVSAPEAWALRGELARKEGLLVSISSAANVVAAQRMAARFGPGSRVETLAWSTGEREFSLGSYF